MQECHNQDVQQSQNIAVAKKNQILMLSQVTVLDARKERQVKKLVRGKIKARQVST